MLAADVWPALLSAYGALVNVPPTAAQAGKMPAVALKGLAEGEQDSIPESPYAWLLNSTGSMLKEIGSDLSMTTWMFNLRLLTDWTNDPSNAERILMPLLEQVRMVHQQHLKLQTGTVVMSMVRAVDWGYIPVNGIWYRSCDVQVEVTEKEIRNHQA